MIKRYLNLPCLILFFLTISVRAQNKRQYVQELSPILVTARGGFEELQFSSAWSAESIDDANKLKLSRSMPEALSGIPSVMIQKTALGQTSPYIRGLTGYHNLLLVDSIRLNHSAMRSGPNQYWSTVETQGSERIEVIRGPNGIIHGADPIGGVVNVLSSNPTFSESGISQGGYFWGRLSSAEHSWSAGLKGTVSNPEWFAELTHVERSFGDLEGGKLVGEQRNTGYDSRGTNFRLYRKLSKHL